MKQQDEFRFVTGLGRILFSDRDFAQAQRAYAALREQPDLLDLAKRHKVVTIFYQNLLQLEQRGLIPPETPLRMACAAEYERAMRHRELLLDELQRLLSRLQAQTPAPKLLFLKGLAIQHYYPEGYVRWMRDLDIMAASPDDALVVFRLLADDGYGPDERELPWFKQDAAQGLPLYGQILVRKDYPDDYSRVDIHYTFYSVSFNAWLDYDLAAHTNQATVRGQTITTLKPEACLLLMAAHMLSQGFIAPKDINDVVAVLATQTIDWDHVIDVAERNQLLPQIYNVARLLLRLYDHPAVTRQCNELLRKARSPRSQVMWQARNRSWLLRALVNSSFTYAFEKRHNSRSTPASLTSAAQCFVYYVQKLAPRYKQRSRWESLLSRLTEPHNLRAGRVNAKTCVRLVPLRQGFVLNGSGDQQPDSSSLTIERQPDMVMRQLAPAMAYVADAGAELVVLNDRAFIPTHDLIIPPEAERASEQLASRIVPRRSTVLEGS